MSRPYLASVTLVAIDTRLPKLALQAMQRSMALVDFGDAIAFVPKGAERGNQVGIKFIEIPGISSSEEYSFFVINKLLDFVKTSHVLIVQWDGFVTNANSWKDQFLEFDYIGATWPQYKDGHDVGNGGFSLRSTRLMKAIRQLEPAQVHPEDICIGRMYRPLLEQRFGIQFAKSDIANEFSAERAGNPGKTFGCHGLANMVDALPSQELPDFLESLPVDVFASTECRGLIKRLIANKQISLADNALKKRTMLLGWSWSSLRLWLRLHSHGWFL